MAARAPIHVADAFELIGRCNESHTVRYALASNGGPPKRWRHAINVHLVQQGGRQYTMASVLPPHYEEAAHLLYT